MIAIHIIIIIIGFCLSSDDNVCHYDYMLKLCSHLFSVHFHQFDKKVCLYWPKVTSPPFTILDFNCQLSFASLEFENATLLFHFIHCL